jgi:predicted TIM-barrel fold metal-dependent hydrolase
LRGVTIGSNVLGKTPDAAEFAEVMGRIDQLALPIFIHPTERDDFPQAWQQFRLDHYIGWPADTAVSVGKMICSGMFDRFKNIKLLLSHLGGPIPSMLGRIDRSFRDGKAEKRPSAYLKTFFFDTAGPATAPGVECASKLFGVEQIVFGTDLPWGQEGDYVERALESVERADLPREKKELIYHANARRLLGL